MEIQGESATSKHVEKMVDILLKRGPRALQCLTDAIIDCAKKMASILLDQEQLALKKDPSDLDRMKEPVNSLRPDDTCCVFQYDNTEEVYSMRRECRGLVYLINNEQFDSLPRRYGTKFDRDDLTKLFRDLHFEVIVENDLTAEKIRHLTKSISTCDKIKDSDCFIFIILTHGDEKGACGIDRISVPVATLTKMFEPNNCPEMNEKPKIFLIQACRGDKKEIVCSLGGPEQNGLQSEGGGDHVDGLNTSDVIVDWEPNISATQTVHSKSDFLVAYSTPEGSLSYRKTDAGSWFIQAVVRVFKSDSRVKDLVEMLGKVNYIVSKGKAKDGGSYYVTVSTFTSSLRKKLFFFPGIYGDKKVHPKCI